MTKYKFTYQDWEQGLIQPDNISDYYNNGWLSFDDFNCISQEQENAFLKRLKETFNILKNFNQALYSESLVKRGFLLNTIQELQEEIDSIQKASLEVRDRVFKRRNIWRSLTKQEVNAYLNADWKDWEWVNKVVFQDCYDKVECFTEFDYILRHNLLEWLKWFQKQEAERNIEPDIMYPAMTFEERVKIAEKALIPDLFTNTSNYNKRSLTVSYTWLNNPDKELPELYKLFIAKQLIHPKTSLEQLKAVFAAKPLREIQPVNWIGAKNLLAYFLDCIQKHKIPINTNIWSVAEKCFVNAEGSVI